MVLPIVGFLVGLGLWLVLTISLYMLGAADALILSTGTGVNLVVIAAATLVTLYSRLYGRPGTAPHFGLVAVSIGIFATSTALFLYAYLDTESLLSCT